MLTDHDIQICISRASINWHEWRDCFEHSGVIEELPVFANSERLGSFTNEYGLRWLGNEDHRAQFAASVFAHPCFKKAIQENDPNALDKVIEDVRDFNGKRQRSAISKLATFAAPSNFIACDKYAIRGVNLILGRQRDFIDSYRQYRDDVEKILAGKIGKSIKKSMQLHPGLPSKRYQKAFLLRVLDNALMTLGGRWS